MNKMRELRRLYENTEIPPELSHIVNSALHQNENGILKNVKSEVRSENENQGELKMSVIKNEANGTGRASAGKGRRNLYRSLTAAAAALAVMVGAFGYGVSTNEAFADSVSGMPLLGTLARVFIGEQVDESDDIIHVEMKLPKVEGLTDKAVEERINTEIHDKMTAIVEDAKQRAAENKKAWLETGGTEDEYMLREVIVDYEVKSISNDVLSFVVSKTETSGSAYYEMYYYNIDLNTNKELTLKDMLGDDYIEIANKQISDEIAVRSKNPDNLYFDGSEGVEGFKTIAADQSFYVNDAGNPVVVFNKYEISPGYMGIQEFEITK